MCGSVSVRQRNALGREGEPLHGVMEGYKVRRRAKSVSNASRAPKSVPNTPHSAPKCVSPPQGRDVLLYPDRATFYNPGPWTCPGTVCYRIRYTPLEKISQMHPHSIFVLTSSGGTQWRELVRAAGDGVPDPVLRRVDGHEPALRLPREVHPQPRQRERGPRAERRRTCLKGVLSLVATTRNF